LGVCDGAAARPAGTVWAAGVLFGVALFYSGPARLLVSIIVRRELA
jgi:hypothetical protein